MDNSEFFITTIIAVYGAILSSLALGLSIWLGISEIRRYKPQISVRLSKKILWKEHLGQSEQAITIEAVNTGFGEHTLVSIGCNSADNKFILLLEYFGPKLPYKLEERKKCLIILPCDFFREFDDKHRIREFFFQDELGNVWTSKIPRKLRSAWRNPQSGGRKLEEYLGKRTVL